MLSWETRARRLARQLVDKGVLRSPPWQRAVEEVPRHIFVPTYYEYGPNGWRAADVSDHEATERWLDRVYSNTALFILPGGKSSSSMPGLMVRMLESLDIEDGNRVLEIGTGSGYNSALLCHHIGDHNVYSIDIEHELVSLARDRLASIGYHPTLVVGDGADGLAEYAPYDRIIATCSVPSIPWAWVQQVTIGGLILADLKLNGHIGNLALLYRYEDRAEGRFSERYGSFMAIRHSESSHSTREPSADRLHIESRATNLELPRPWENFVFWFFAHMDSALQITSYGQEMDSKTGLPGNACMIAADGSWCEIEKETRNSGSRTVWQSGPRRLWDLIEAAHERWTRLGAPGWQRFGLTVTETRQTVWLDSPSSDLSWIAQVTRW
ncbi:MAG: methyltransferase domain-containing protein [Pseudonocardia sp.]|nr:methyltransferase domain-containing protein [Pseudonocardia sp.]